MSLRFMPCRMVLFALVAAALVILPAWSAGAQTEAPPETNFEKSTLTGEVGEPAGLAVAPDGRVFHTERKGELRVYSPESGSTQVAGELDVYTGQEDGLQGVELDPDFEENGWIYLYYAPDEGESVNVLSRFTVEGNQLDMGSEERMLEVDTQRQECCHVGGDMTFDEEGDLYIATGDNTNPFESDAYTPIDERDGREAFDAQRTSANTNDLRGKLLKITPEDDGGYSIPEGNLFEPGTEDTRPEIYGMGFRNPFRIALGPESGQVAVADYGPDASEADPDRGPKGLVEWNLVDEPGNYGWPYCTGDSQAYNDYDFATEESGAEFDCEAPVNDSPNNTGLTELPPAQDADVWYGYDESEVFPELGAGGGGPMAGPFYDYDPDLDSDGKFPEYFDGSAFFYEWTRNYVKEFRFDGNNNLQDIEPFMDDTEFLSPMDMEFGPDGTMYVLEYGNDGYFVESPEAKLSQISYATEGERAPIAQADAEPTSGDAPLEVEFSSEGSNDPDPGDEISYEWDFGDGETSTEANPTHTYTENGDYGAQLTVTDSTGRSSTANEDITVGNNEPEVDIEQPVDGGFFDFGDEIPYDVSVTDEEDGSTENGDIDCEEVSLTASLGHNQHAHPLENLDDCEGVFEAAQAGHNGNEDIFYVLGASYEDRGAEGVSSLEGSDQVFLNPKRKQAEHYESAEGVKELKNDDTAGGGSSIAFDDGDYVSFDPVNLKNIDSLTYRLSEGDARGKIEVRAGSPDGELVSNAGPGRIKTSGPQDGYKNVTVPIKDPGGTDELFFVFKEAGNTGGELLQVNWMQFNGQGVSSD